MEFTNEIFFNKPLTAGSTVIITYCGKLYREHSKDVSIVYGYGDDWSETDNSPMVETDNGFEVTLTIKDYNTFNFCFTNSFNIWDNNSGFNYIAPISKPHSEEPKVEDIEQKEQVTEEEINNDTEEQQENQTEETAESATDTVENFENLDQDEDIEAAFASLLDSILDGANSENETIDISNLSGFGLQSIDEIKEEDMINCDDIFAELFEELTVDEVKGTVAQAEVQEEQRESEITNYDKYDAQELDNLMDNLLTSISDTSETSDYATPIQTIESQEKDLSNENVGLPATRENEDWLDKIINISFDLTKKFTTACKKFGTLIKLKAKELGIISDK